jgi:hypothetical protein
VRLLLGKFVITVYRAFGLIALYSVLAGVLAYISTMGFYSVSNTWGAPVVMTQSDKDSLELLSKIVTSKQSLETLSVDCERLKASIVEMRRHRAALQAIDAELDTAIVRERDSNRVNGEELSELNTRKRVNNTETAVVMEKTKLVEAKISEELAAGLITKTDAAMAMAALKQASNAATDGEIAEVLLRDNVLQKSNTDTKMLEILAKHAELKSQIESLSISIHSGEEQWRIECAEVARLHDAIAVAQQNPVYPALSGETTVLFIPYDNEAAARVGAPVYDCLLGMIACRQVGTLQQIFQGEQHATHPIFKSEMRGFLAQLDLTDPKAAKSKTLFLGRRPLLI